MYLALAGIIRTSQVFPVAIAQEVGSAVRIQQALDVLPTKGPWLPASSQTRAACYGENGVQLPSDIYTRIL